MMIDILDASSHTSTPDSCEISEGDHTSIAAGLAAVFAVCCAGATSATRAREPCCAPNTKRPC